MTLTVTKSVRSQPADLFSAAVTSLQVPLTLGWQQDGTQVSFVFALLMFRKMAQRLFTFKDFCCYPECGNDGGEGNKIKKH